MGTRRGELLQRRTHPATEAAVDTRAKVGVAGRAPFVYRAMSPVLASVPQVRSTPGALGLCGVRVDG